MWGIDLREQNQRFLEGFDASYFNYIADVHGAALTSDSKHHAALALRLTYAQALETFFALLCAAIQAPTCPLGWLLRYRPYQLYELVRKLSQGSPVLTRLPSPLSWQSLSGQIHRITLSDMAEVEDIKRFFGETWARLAQDFLGDHSSDEYNNIKHGLRVRSGGFSFQLLASDQPDATPVIDSQSVFGSRFFTSEQIVVHDVIDKINFFVQEVGRNWTPIALAVRLELLSVSIGNVLSYLKLCGGFGGDSVSFGWPVLSSRQDAELAWSVDYKIETIKGGYTVLSEHITPFTKEEVLAAISV